MKRTLALVAVIFLNLAWPRSVRSCPRRKSIATITQVLDRAVTNVEKEFVPPRGNARGQVWLRTTDGEFKGVRTFAQQVKHVAAVNYDWGRRSSRRSLPSVSG